MPPPPSVPPPGTPEPHAARALSANPPRWLKPLFALVLVFLVAQFVLREVRSEMFPTFLLPSGPTLYRTTPDGMVYSRTEYYAVGPDGTETLVPLKGALKGVSSSFLRYLAGDNPSLQPRGGATEERLEEMKAWLRQRLEAALGHPAVALRVVKRTYRMHPFSADRTEEVLQTQLDTTLSLVPDP